MGRERPTGLSGAALRSGRFAAATAPLLSLAQTYATFYAASLKSVITVTAAIPCAGKIHNTPILLRRPRFSHNPKTARAKTRHHHPSPAVGTKISPQWGRGRTSLRDPKLLMRRMLFYSA
jgi:hypothetical protein